jgi:uncharacterized protein with von Willebrand factor type A (vWA) domain
MDRTLAQFVRALRNADVRVSTAETLDAMRVVDLIGYDNRELLKTGLSLALPKTAEEKAVFDVCFERFFARRDNGKLLNEARRDDLAESVSEQPTEAPSDNDGNEGQGAGNEESQSASGGQLTGEGSQGQTTELEVAAESLDRSHLPEPESALGQLLMRGDRTEVSVAVTTAGEQVGVQRIEVFTQKGVYTRRIMDALGNAELQQEINERSAREDLTSRALAQELTRRREWLREYVRDHVEHQFMLHADVTGKRLREDLLRRVMLANVEPRHHQQMKDIVQRMAKRLATQYSRRRKVFRRGQLNVARTLRKNMSYDGAIFDLQWRSEKVDRPKVFAVCDVSGSVAQYSRFMLMFLYSLGEVLPRVRSFAFSSDLGEVTDLFQRYDIDDALAHTLRDYSAGATDYGRAFLDFEKLCLDDVDKRTTVLILGDARNNYGDPGADTLKRIYDRCRRLIWLNPEPRSSWNVGDSEMRVYAAYSHQVEECSSLAHLERVVGKLLKLSA